MTVVGGPPWAGPGVSAGQTFIIAKAGKPMAKVIPYAAERRPEKKRLGFLQGRFGDTAKVKEVGAEEIRAMFEDET